MLSMREEQRLQRAEQQPALKTHNVAKVATHLSHGVQAANAPQVLMLSNRPAEGEAIAELEANGFVVKQLDSRGTPEPMDLAEADVIVLALSSASEACEWCRTLRGRQIQLPIMASIDKVTAFDEALLLELGADQVVTASDETRLMVSRLRALLRRSTGSVKPPSEEVLTFGRLTIDSRARRVMLAGEAVPVSACEFDLLWMLASHAGEVLRRDFVQMQLRGFIGAESHRYIDARFYRLRHRFGNTPEVIARIRTVRPYGYLFAKLDW